VNVKEAAQLLSVARGTVAVLLLAASSVAGAQQPGSPGVLKPYRVLLVVDKWVDPTSQLITSEQDSFQPVAALLKAWSVPFEILRLDQQSLGAPRRFERTGRVRYGAILWLADAASYAGKNVAAVDDAAQGGISVLVLDSRCLDPALERVPSWQLWLADRLRQELKSAQFIDISVDKEPPTKLQTKYCAAAAVEDRDSFGSGEPRLEADSREVTW
jgi:hypothetical protein